MVLGGFRRGNAFRCSARRAPCPHISARRSSHRGPAQTELAAPGGASEPCYTSADFALEGSALTDMHGYAEVRMRVDRRWIGRFTVLLSLGGFYASNAFTQTLAFDVADVKSFPSCAVADAAPSFAPALQVNSPPPHASMRAAR